MPRLPLLAVIALSAVLALPAGVSAAGHKPIPQGSVGYRLTYTGLVYINYKDQGSSQNASCPQFTDDQTPFSEKDTIKVAWTTSWQFAFNPSARSQSRALNAHSTILHGSNFSFSGTYDDASTCAPVKFGAQGPCTGVLKNDGPGLLILHLTKARKNEDFVLNIEPFGPLSPTPPSCMDNDSPPASHMLTVDLTALSNALAAHAFSTFEVLGRGVSRTKHWNIDRSDNCSNPGPDQGDTDTCSTTTTGAAIFDLQPIND